MQRHIIGLGGRAESGKTTAANMLTDIILPKNHQHIEFSDPIISTAQNWLSTIDNNLAQDTEYQIELLSQVLKDTSGEIILDKNSFIKDVMIDQDYLKNVLNNNIERNIDYDNKLIHRPLLEWLGFQAIKLTSPTIWGEIVKHKIDDAISEEVDLITVGGIRTKTDNLIIRNEGGITVKINRPSMVDNINQTEYQLNDWVADFDINNDGSLRELYEKLHNTWEYISKNELTFNATDTHHRRRFY